MRVDDLIGWIRRRSAPTPRGFDVLRADTLLAVLTRDDVVLGHLRLTFDTMFTKLGRRRWSPGFPVVHWVIVWTDDEAERQGYPFDDGTDLDSNSVIAELDNGYFTLRAVKYPARVLDEPEKAIALAKIFEG